MVKKNNASAELILTNAAVYTVDRSRPRAEAVAVGGGRILAVGSEDEITAWKGDSTEVIDLGGRLVLPAFIDSHMHPADSAVEYMFRIKLHGLYSKEDYLSEIRSFVEKNPGLPAYEGGGFQRSIFGEAGPRKEDLDAIVADRPVAIQSVDCHSLWVNSKALELAGISEETPDPPGGLIKRVGDGSEPSGLLSESARRSVQALFKPVTRDEYKQSLLWLQRWFNSLGITSCHDAIVRFIPDYYNAYEELAREGSLTVRYRGSWLITPEIVGGGEGQAEDFRPEMSIDEAVAEGTRLSAGFNTPYWQVNSFKFFADQVIEEETGYLKEPYLHRGDDWRGIRVWKQDALNEAFRKVDAAGFNIHTHQIGDAAASYALDALEYAREKNGIRDSRHTFAHIQMIDETDIARMAAMGMNAVISPYWSVVDDYYWELYYPYLGAERAFNGQYPGAGLIRAGVNTSFHSDFSVTEPDFGQAIYCAVTRTQPEKTFRLEQGERAGSTLRSTEYSGLPEPGTIVALGKPEERMSIEQAVEAATMGGARADFLEQDLGSIEPGKLADIIVLDRDIFNIDIEDVAGLRVVKTFFEGRLVWDADAEGAAAD